MYSKFADHQPLHRQEKIFERQGVNISRKTMGGWLPSVAELLAPLYQASKKLLFESKAIGTDDTGVKVLDRKLPFARIGRIWPYVGDAHHPVVVYDYTPTRGRNGPAKFLEGYQGYLQADAYSVYDAFFKPARGLTEVGCWMHARRYFFKALESDQQRMGPALHLIARLYGVEDRSKGLTAEERLALRQRLSAPVMEKLHKYVLEIRQEVLRKRLVNRDALIAEPRAFCVKSGLGGGEGFPVVWEQLLDPADRMRGHSREHIAEPGKRLDRIPLAHRDEA